MQSGCNQTKATREQGQSGDLNAFGPPPEHAFTSLGTASNHAHL